MNNWQPTLYFRFVKKSQLYTGDIFGEPPCILQQKWRKLPWSNLEPELIVEEWRDVPLVENE